MPGLEQVVLADFITEGHLEHHIRRMRSLYDRRRRAPVAALMEQFGDGQGPASRGQRVTILGENAGLHVMVRFDTIIPDADLIARADQVGVGLISASPGYLGPSPGHEFIFSYTELDEGAIAAGIERLAALFKI